MPKKRTFQKGATAQKLCCFLCYFGPRLKKSLVFCSTQNQFNRNESVSKNFNWHVNVYLSREKKKFRQNHFAPQSFLICLWKRLCYLTSSPPQNCVWTKFYHPKNASFAFCLKTLSQNCSEKNDESKKMIFLAKF